MTRSCGLNLDCFVDVRLSDEVHAPFPFTTTSTTWDLCPPTPAMKNLRSTRATQSENPDLLTASNRALESVKGVLDQWFLPVQLITNPFAYYHYRNCPTDPYKKFVGFYTRSQDAFVNYSLVLDAAMSLEVEEFGDLTKEQCVLFFFLPYVVIHIVCMLDFFMKTAINSRSIAHFAKALVNFPLTF